MSVVARLEEECASARAGARRPHRAGDWRRSSGQLHRALPGRVKGGEAVYRLVLEHHPALTLQSLEDIAVEAAARFDVSHVRVVHRCGDIATGEPIVFAGAAALHRRAAFEAADYLMDRLKTEAVFWKREIGEAGAEWIEPTEADYADRERWG